MTVTNGEIIMLAAPVAAAAMAGITAWVSFKSVMRRRAARKTKEARYPDAAFFASVAAAEADQNSSVSAEERLLGAIAALNAGKVGTSKHPLVSGHYFREIRGPRFRVFLEEDAVRPQTTEAPKGAIPAR
jgi:hypothetical protein